MTSKLARLGKSGLKVSRIALGCMSYGNPEWRKWMLSEEEGIQQVKFAYALTFNFRLEPRPQLRDSDTKTAFKLLTQPM